MMCVKFGTLLYKMQIAGYDNRKYWGLVFKSTVGKVKITARVRRLRFVSRLLSVLGLGLPLLCMAHT